MRKIGLRCLTFSAAVTSGSAAAASNLYSASISGTSYLRSRSEKIGSTFKLLVMIFLPISNGRKVSSKERGIPSARRTRRILTPRPPLGQGELARQRSHRQLQFACQTARLILNSARFCVILGAATSVPLPR
jgi:hypothetical protein